VVDTRSVLARLAERPAETGVLLDVDGTLAPIVDRPEDAAVPEATRLLLAELAGRYALVACVSGRREDELERMVGVDGVVLVGEHGLGLDPQAAEWRDRIDELVAEVSRPAERKRFSVAYHYRTAADERAAVDELALVAERAAALGLRARWGRKVLEVLPPVDAGKAAAVRALLTGRGLRRALYAGDDSTDLEAFGGLAGLEVAVRVAVVSAEGPTELRDAADVVVADPEELAGVLRLLL
jgi:trehalose 6-phosphate phosphatase